MKDFDVIILNPKRRIICDGCSEDFTNSERIGGVLLGRNAYCPHCSPRIIESAKDYHEESHLTYPNPLESFRDFVYRIR